MHTSDGTDLAVPGLGGSGGDRLLVQGAGLCAQMLPPVADALAAGHRAAEDRTRRLDLPQRFGAASRPRSCPRSAVVLRIPRTWVPDADSDRAKVTRHRTSARGASRPRADRGTVNAPTGRRRGPPLAHLASARAPGTGKGDLSGRHPDRTAGQAAARYRGCDRGHMTQQQTGSGDEPDV